MCNKSNQTSPAFTSTQVLPFINSFFLPSISFTSPHAEFLCNLPGPNMNLIKTFLKWNKAPSKIFFPVICRTLIQKYNITVILSPFSNYYWTLNSSEHWPLVQDFSHGVPKISACNSSSMCRLSAGPLPCYSTILLKYLWDILRVSFVPISHPNTVINCYILCH